MATTHCLKTQPHMYRQLANGERIFDVRHNDRQFQEGDTVTLQEFHPDPRVGDDTDNPPGYYTGQSIHRRVNRIFTDVPGLQPGYVAMEYRPLAAG